MEAVVKSIPITHLQVNSGELARESERVTNIARYRNIAEANSKMMLDIRTDRLDVDMDGLSKSGALRRMDCHRICQL